MAGMTIEVTETTTASTGAGTGIAGTAGAGTTERLTTGVQRLAGV
jgi:hypothetical protein